MIPVSHFENQNVQIEKKVYKKKYHSTFHLVNPIQFIVWGHRTIQISACSDLGLLGLYFTMKSFLCTMKAMKERDICFYFKSWSQVVQLTMLHHLSREWGNWNTQQPLKIYCTVFPTGLKYTCGGNPYLVAQTWSALLTNNKYIWPLTHKFDSLNFFYFTDPTLTSICTKMALFGTVLLPDLHLPLPRWVLLLFLPHWALGYCCCHSLSTLSTCAISFTDRQELRRSFTPVWSLHSVSLQ